VVVEAAAMAVVEVEAHPVEVEDLPPDRMAIGHRMTGSSIAS
jgi:hypothetical protein